MSESVPGVTYPLGTRTATTRAEGVAAGLDEIATLEPPALFIEAPTTGASVDLRPIEERVRRAGRPLLGVCGALRNGAAVPVRLDVADDAAAHAAVDALSGTLPFLARTHCRRIVVPIGDGDVPGAAATRALLSDARDPAEIAAGFRSTSRASGECERAVDRVIRRLDVLARRERQVEVLLMPSGDPLSLLDLEAATWIVEDLPGGNVSVALDLGSVALMEDLGTDSLDQWLSNLGSRVGLVLLSDRDVHGSPHRLPGMGIARLGDIREALPRTVPWVLRGDPELPGTWLRESADHLERALGPAPDLR